MALLAPATWLAFTAWLPVACLGAAAIVSCALQTECREEELDDDDDEVTELKIKAFLDDKVWNASTPKISLHVIHLMKPKRELMYIIEGLGTEEIANTIIQGIPEH